MFDVSISVLAICHDSVLRGASLLAQHVFCFDEGLHWYPTYLAFLFPTQQSYLQEFNFANLRKGYLMLLSIYDLVSVNRPYNK
jgi:hypothetical protein